MSLLVNDIYITNLWTLGVLGITEPIERDPRKEMPSAAKDLFLETMRVDKNGHYEVCLPWLEGHSPLPTNYSIAKKRLVLTLKILKIDQRMHLYYAVFSVRLDEGIVKKVREPSLPEDHYLPHRPVYKTLYKIRPVYDASARENGRLSLNKCLDKEPNLIELISSIMLRFRDNPFGVVSNIRKAFLQISVRNTDRNFLKFLWFNDCGNLTTYRHNRVIFGINTCPFLL